MVRLAGGWTAVGYWLRESLKCASVVQPWNSGAGTGGSPSRSRLSATAREKNLVAFYPFIGAD